MSGAVIRNGKHTPVIDLPTGMMDLQTKLSSIGIQETSDKIKLSDEDNDPIRVKLYATEPEDIKAAARLRFESDPNIRAVISLTHDGEVEIFSLLMSDRELKEATTFICSPPFVNADAASYWTFIGQGVLYSTIIGLL